MSDVIHILYADDDDDIRELLSLSLELTGGFVVDAVENGRQAVEKAIAVRPDLVILDVMMPGLDGPATLEQMRGREALAGVPVIFFTAKAQREEIAKLEALGAIGVLSKPFDPVTVGEEIRAIYQRHGG